MPYSYVRRSQSFKVRPVGVIGSQNVVNYIELNRIDFAEEDHEWCGVVIAGLYEKIVLFVEDGHRLCAELLAGCKDRRFGKEVCADNDFFVLNKCLSVDVIAKLARQRKEV